MSRILFWTALICLVVFAIRSKIRGAQKRAEQQMREAQQRQQAQASGGYAPHATPRATSQAAIEAETMLECAHCGVFFPASEAVRFDGAIYCSKAHAALPPN
ncbi:PP0621 family protein [Duganella phyllosphaerae]|uniref:Pyrimidine deaminase n=1 Tax=Duganella phyllosphaerae TaxID=762836 RepID=A0A1E7WCB6_9BURK|nr:PP0621 family protein [Duganella phyllosphaerae]OEZ94598.1 hypothetical protein DUPY_45510 [Duganella phyllosphaerae]